MLTHTSLWHLFLDNGRIFSKHTGSQNKRKTELRFKNNLVYLHLLCRHILVERQETAVIAHRVG